MGITFDDLQTWYAQTVAQRAADAVAVAPPETPVEQARFALAQIVGRDAIIDVLHAIVEALEDIEARASAPTPKATGTADTTDTAPTTTPATGSAGKSSKG